jgi:K+-sensing histidine kinase KdpD
MVKVGSAACSCPSHLLTADVTPEGAVAIRVRDTGVGIPAENLGMIFDEFAQLPSPGREPAKGWGLGLAICRRLIRAMGGTVGVESVLGRGSVFTVRLPLRGIAEGWTGHSRQWHFTKAHKERIAHNGSRDES